jgi:hypothetical protein
MNTLAFNIETPYAVNVQITEDTITVDLSDGRTISAPLAWFPRLEYVGSEERANWRLIGKGQGIHWEDLDEDISVDGLLAGRPSGESQDSLKRWLERRKSPSPTSQ